MFDTRQGLAFCGDSYLVFFHSHVTAVERKKRSWTFYQKCRWNVTVNHAYKCRWKFRSKHLVTLDPAKSERADDAVHRHSLGGSRGNELARRMLVHCRLSSQLLVLLTAACAASVRTSAEITMLSLQSVENQPI